MNVTIQFTEPMLGTVAKDPEVYRTFIESKKPDDGKHANEDESATVPTEEESGWSGFHSDEGGLFIYDYMIVGFLKYAGNVLKDVVKVKALKSKVNDFVFVMPRRIRLLGADGAPLTKPDDVLERPLRASTPQGQRSALTRSDLVKADTRITFEVKLIPHKEVTEKLIGQLLEHGELSGLGQWRNGGYGRFKVVSITSDEEDA